MECHSNWRVIKNGTSLKIKCHSNWYVTQIGMSLKFEYLPNLKITKIGMSLKLKYQSNWNVTQFGMSHKLECHSNCKTKLIEKVLNPETSKSASIGRISILFYSIQICYFTNLRKLKINSKLSIFGGIFFYLIYNPFRTTWRVFYQWSLSCLVSTSKAIGFVLTVRQ